MSEPTMQTPTDPRLERYAMIRLIIAQSLRLMGIEYTDIEILDDGWAMIVDIKLAPFGAHTELTKLRVTTWRDLQWQQLIRWIMDEVATHVSWLAEPDTRSDEAADRVIERAERARQPLREAVLWTGYSILVGD